MTLQENCAACGGRGLHVQPKTLSNVPPAPVRSIHSRQGQLEAFCLHLLHFMNSPSGAQSRLCSLWVSVFGRWGLAKKTPFFPPFLERSKTHIYSIMLAGLLVTVSEESAICSLCLQSCYCGPLILSNNLKNLNKDKDNPVKVPAPSCPSCTHNFRHVREMLEQIQEQCSCLDLSCK